MFAAPLMRASRAETASGNGGDWGAAEGNANKSTDGGDGVGAVRCRDVGNGGGKDGGRDDGDEGRGNATVPGGDDGIRDGGRDGGTD